MQPARVSHPDLTAITVFLASTATPERGGLAYLDAVLPAEERLATRVAPLRHEHAGPSVPNGLPLS